MLLFPLLKSVIVYLWKMFVWKANTSLRISGNLKFTLWQRRQVIYRFTRLNQKERMDLWEVCTGICCCLVDSCWQLHLMSLLKEKWFGNPGLEPDVLRNLKSLEAWVNIQSDHDAVDYYDPGKFFEIETRILSNSEPIPSSKSRSAVHLPGA